MRADAARFAVIGSPIEHSLSPVLHRTAYRLLGVGGVRYGRFEVREGELASFVEHGPGRDLEGMSVTMPGKPEAFALATESDRTAAELGIANTLIRLPDGGWRAENHDVHGVMASLRDHGAQAPAIGAVLGSGATALCAVAALTRLGAGEILLSARNRARLMPLEALAARAGVSTRMVEWEHSSEVLEADAVISAVTSEGASAVAERWRSHGRLPRAGVFLDAIYDPWPAPLAAVVATTGAEIADGLEMLAHQADMQLRSMIGVDAAPVEQMLAAARRALSSGQDPDGAR